MDNQTLEILKLVASFLTPLILLLFGILLNKRLEERKLNITKEKGWQEYWANKFLDVAHDYNTCVTAIVTGLFQLKQISDEKLAGWDNDVKQKEVEVRNKIRKLQYLEWEIQNFVQFVPKKGDSVKEAVKELYSLLANLINTKQGNLEEIRNAQFRFNDSVRLAHAEMLEISSDKVLQKKSKYYIDKH